MKSATKYRATHNSTAVGCCAVTGSNITRVKRTLFALLAAIVLSAFSTPAHTEVVDRVVAIINDNIITLSELNAATSMALENISGNKPTDKKSIDEFKKSSLDNLINQKLIKQASDAAGIDISKKEIDNAIEDVKKQNNLTQESLMLALARSNLTMREYREQMQEQLREAKFVDIEFKSKISVLSEEVEDYYRQNIKEFLQPSTFRARMILLPGTDKEIQALKLSAIEEGIRKGESFAELASQYSEGPGASEGGDLGWLSKGELDSTLEAVIDRLKTGEVSPPVTRPEGIYLLQLTRSRASAPASIAESTPVIQKTLFNRRMEKRFASWLKEARRLAHIEIRL
ncbi:MAG: SurA N-terminal domain-containing protein [Proteobacteria bacterium]|nr:SurA N-terminal domain-containing protein [Pseudomonadota bacterium]